MNEQVKAIRAEVERRLKYTHDWLRGDEKRHPNQTFVSKNYYKMKGDERTLDALLNFIDSLPEEPSETVTTCNDLEEAKEAYCNEHNDDCFDATGDTCPHIRRAFIAGAEWQKRQMLEDAVGVEVVGKMRDLRIIDSTQRCMFNAERGDWLRIIIVKEDKK